MKPAKIIHGILAANSGVTALVSTRLYVQRVPQDGSFPCVQYNIIDIVPVKSKSKSGDSDFSRVQINCYGKSYAVSTELADAVRTALEAYSGTINTIKVSYIELLTVSEAVDDNSENDSIYDTMLEFMMYYRNG